MVLGLLQTQTGKIASPLRIQSILSPADPSEDERNTLSIINIAKRTYEQAFAVPGELPELHPPASPATSRPGNIQVQRPQAPPVPGAGGGGGGGGDGGEGEGGGRGGGGLGHRQLVEDENRSVGFAVGAGEGRRGAKRPPMRSSIACLRCRKSKIKCDNDGKAVTPCDTCIKTGKDCQYPEIAPLPPKRPDPPTVIRRDGDAGQDRKRLRKVDEASRLDTQVSAALYADDVLSASYLTESLWTQIFDIYKLHFATELPFLHMPTLKEKMGNKFRVDEKDMASQDTNLVLLGVLALTARFHADLVKYVVHSSANQIGSGKSRPMQHKFDASSASEYFAEALTRALGPLRTSMAVGTVERVQAFLMLGLYEWSQARPRTGGLGAWMYVGVAIRMAQALGLGLGDRHQKHERGSRRIIGPESRAALLPADQLIAREVRRRTMFSCLVLDRLLSCGGNRFSTIRSEDLQIQLPCPETVFDLSHPDVPTGFLKYSPGEIPTPLPVQNDSVLARFIKLVDIWGEISKFSFAGGRLVEHEPPPWNEGSNFRRLRQELDAFYSDLPPTFMLSKSNYHRHENHQASSVYVSMHMLGSVCQIMLHREYVPFIPIRCQSPTGPLDEPTFPEGAPPKFWEDSAEQLFRAARDIVNLIETCQSREKLPMSALVLFAIWTAAFVGIYAWHFPHMDTRPHMLAGDGEEGDIYQGGPTGTTYQALGKMSGWLKMACTYSEYFQDMDKYYKTVKEHYHRHLNAHAGEDNLSIRTGGNGGGLEEWKKQRGKILNNGTILAEDDGHNDGSEDSRASTMERGSSMGPDRYNAMGADGVRTPRSTPSMSFTAINSASMASTQADAHPDFRQDGLPAAAEPQWNRFPGPPAQHSPRGGGALGSPHGVVPDMGMYYTTPAGVIRYVASHQGLRWGDTGPAAGLEAFSHGDSDGPAVWADPKLVMFDPGHNAMGAYAPQQYGVEYGMAQ